MAVGEATESTFARLGDAFLRSSEGAGYTLYLLFAALGGLPRLAGRFPELVRQCASCALSPLPVTVVVALFSGMILSLQTGIELARYGQEQVIGLIVASSMCREMGPFITGIVLASSVGSAMAAEIGTMRVSEEVDALEVMAIDPIRFLATPRILSLTLAAPLLTALTDAVGILGGALVGYGQLGVDPSVYLRAARSVLESPDLPFPKDLYTGLAKAALYGAAIAAIGCAQGLRATGGAIGVGRATRRAVIQSFLMVLILGYILTWLFYR